MKIVVLAGGLSPERDVSLASGALISNALIAKGHDVMLLDLYLGTNNPDIEPVCINAGTGHRFSYTVPETEPDLEAIRARVPHQDTLIGEGVLALCGEADAVFLALHGSIGENGKLQAVLDVHGIRYTGTGYIGSLLAMDKDLSKRLMAAAHILTPAWQRLDLQANEIPASVSYPCVVKPCSCGSSVGVTMAQNAEDLQNALVLARKYEDTVIIEERIEGREFSVGILAGRALPVIEIKPVTGFYDYKNKYQKGLTEEICPAELSPEMRELLQSSALRVYETLRLGFYSRVDFIVDKFGRAHCLEANTLPGMTPTSLLPQEASAEGIPYEELCEQIVLGAF